MKRGQRTWSSLVPTLLVLAFTGFVRAQQNAEPAVDRALDLLEDNTAREAVAILADAARRDPQDRKLGNLLYTLLRDRHWPLPQTFPVKLPGAITAMDFNLDGNLVIAGTEDGTVRVLNCDTGKLFDGAVKHPGSIVGVRLLPGNELAFSVGKAGYARLWKITDGTIVREWSNRDSTFTAYVMSKDYKRIALGYANGEVRVYDLENGNQIGEPVKHSKAITGLVFSPDGEELGTASADGTARVWDLKAGKPRAFVVKHKAALTSVDIDYLGMWLLTASDDGVAKVTNAKDGKPITPDVKCGARIREARLSPSGIHFHTVLGDHTVRIWDSYTGKPVEGVIRTADGIAGADWGPAGISMVTASDGPVAYTWRVKTGQATNEGMLHQSSVRVAAYGPNSRRIATGCGDGILRVWRVDVGAATQALPSIHTHDAPVRTAFFSADGKGLVSCAHDLTTTRWDMEKVGTLGRVLRYDTGPVCAVYSPDRDWVVTVTEDGRAFVTDGKSGEPHGSPRDLGAPGRWVDFHKDGKHFVTTAGTKAIVWSIDDATAPGTAIEHPAGGHRELRMARFSPNGNLIVTAGNDGSARIWDTYSHKQVVALQKHQGAVTGARFSIDGKLLVTTGADSTIIVWDTTTWEAIGLPVILPGQIYSAVIGPNDQFVAATSQLSEGIRFFEISTGREFGDGIDLPSDAVSLDLHRSGDELAVACEDGTVRTYDSPWVQEDIPNWMPDFAEKIIGLRVDSPDKFAPVYSSYDEMKRYPPTGTTPDSDFGRLAKWMITYGIDRTTSPRTFATIESNVTQRVAERSLDALYDLFEAQPANPLIFSALSLFVPSQREGEFLANYALARADKYPLARAYVASTFAKYGRMNEADRIMNDALAAAPTDVRVLRRAAKLDTHEKRKEAAIEKLERAVAADPDDEVTYRDYGWQMYDLGESAKAMAQFEKADELCGGGDIDVNAGIALAAAAIGDKATAIARYQRLIKIDDEWGDPDYVKNLTGWTEKELVEMERTRKLAMAAP